MRLTGNRSAIVVPVRLPRALEAIRREHVDNASLGVPAHVTLLFPFVPPPRIDEEALQRAAAAIRRSPAFDVDFTDVAIWEPDPTPEGVLWLPPQPSEPFVDMTEALLDAFPGYRPYEGLHDEIVPHLTIGHVRLHGVDVEAIRAHLPFRRRAEAAVLLVESRLGRWRIARRLRLG